MSRTRDWLVLLACAGLVSAQSFGSTCSNGTVADVAALASQYPALGTIASILASDDDALTLFKSINGTALSYPLSVIVGNVPKTTGYPADDPYCWSSASKCVDSKIKGIPVDGYTCAEPATWGLSIDDGPTCAHTPLYTLLKQNKLSATLFYIGTNVATYPDEAQQGLANGHNICVETWSKPWMTALTNEQVFAELYYTKKIIKNVIGYTPRCWRPPFGDVDDRVRTIATALELWTIVGDSDTQDWLSTPGNTTLAAESYAHILRADYSMTGTLVLTSELSDTTVDLFAQHWPLIEQKFKHVVSPHTCYNITAPYAEMNSPQCQNFTQAAANPQLQSFTPPAVAGSSGSMVFSGQMAFLESLKGVNIPSANITLAAPSATVPTPTSSSIASSAAPATQSASRDLANVPDGDNDSHTEHHHAGAIAGGVIGGLFGLACLLLALLCAWRRSWLCFGARSSKDASRPWRPIYISSPEAEMNFAGDRSAQALLDPHSPFLRSRSSFGSHSQLELPPSPGKERSSSLPEQQVGVALGGDELMEHTTPHTSPNPNRSTFDNLDCLIPPSPAAKRSSAQSLSGSLKDAWV